MVGSRTAVLRQAVRAVAEAERGDADRPRIAASEIKPGADVVTHDIEVEPAAALPVRIRDADGKSLTGVRVTGISLAAWHGQTEVKGDTYAAYTCG